MLGTLLPGKGATTKNVWKYVDTLCTCVAGVNGAGKTTQLQVVMGRLSPDSGEIIKAKRNMRIAYLAQASACRQMLSVSKRKGQPVCFKPCVMHMST